MPPALDKSLNRLLKEVSRSFYLTLRVLPRAIRPQIGLAYLLARTTDTIADTEIVPLEKRLNGLQALRGRILDQPGEKLDFGELARCQGLPAERLLLERQEEALALLYRLSPDDRQLVRQVLTTITSGQELDLTCFGSANPHHVIAFATDTELRDYTYRVAGCVGEFWTKMCRLHLFPQAVLDDTELLANGIQFGQGLQLVNILRDLPADLRRGRCYLPAERLKQIGLVPGDLLDPANESRLRPLYQQYLEQARHWLGVGWNYTNRLPRACVRVRLACAWPILIGLKTVNRLGIGPILDPRTKIKASRAEVRGILARTILYYPLPSVWQRLAKL